ncbi:MAG TPA: 2OG-Fe(II) oxygenase [Stellaceae bacterium]|nr:2OG-Fe(II) oxygenase [Stellaceae bacterium]
MREPDESTTDDADRSEGDIADRVARLPWDRLTADLDARGYATVPLFDAGDCAVLRGLYGDDAAFRKTVVMERHAYGRGEYRYWRYPLPAMVAGLRRALYAGLAPLAGDWARRLATPGRPAVAYPASHEAYLARCHAAGQTRPTPLILRYEADGFNCLHQDLYGEHVFPIQATVLLSTPMAAPGTGDFSGGEFTLVEQRPRAQSRVEVVPLTLGEMVLFAVRDRPAQGARGDHRVTLRHGVSRVRGGERYTVGVILHDAA